MRVCFETLGCKVNQYETQALETLFKERGHTVCAAGDGCDAVVVNTCAVTAESGRKSRQAVRRLKRLEPGAAVAVCGCFSQISPGEMEALGVDLVSGSGDRRGFVTALEDVLQDKTARRRVDAPEKRRIFESLPAGSAEGRTRAMLKIQDGCQNYCAYCVIPYARGPVRSLPPEEARAQAARLGREGYGEIVVTGIEISSYGRDLGGGASLAQVLGLIAGAAPKARLRLGSLDPGTVTEELCAALAALPRLCGHFHLSLQSGCDATLRRMRRRYDTAGFMAAADTLRHHFPGCAITADLIVGFPGETDAEFEETLSFIRRCGFASMHIFPYSRRPGTAAADMPGQISAAVKKERARRATELARELARDYRLRQIGQTVEVLFERETGEGSVGRAGNHLEVCAAGRGLRNICRPVRLICEKDGLLFGEIIEP